MNKMCSLVRSRPTAGRPLSLLLAVSAVLGVPSMAVGHHSNSLFDLDNVYVLNGTVTRFDWTNPHVYLVIEDDNGTEWMVETDAIAVMIRSGWAEDSFVPGDLVSARINRDRIETKAHGLLLSIQNPEGEQLVSLNRFRDSMITYDRNAFTTTLSGVWQADQALSRVFSDGMRELPLTEAGRLGKTTFDGSVDPEAECIAWPAPWLVASTLYLVGIEPGDEVTTIKSEFYNAERIVHMGLREHPQNIERTVQGHSIGWWEGDTLVVDTTAYADHRSPYANIGIPSGAMKHTIERFRLEEDGRTISVDLFLEDPEYLAEPFATQLALHYAPHLEMHGIDCDPEVATRYRR